MLKEEAMDREHWSCSSSTMRVNLWILTISKLMNSKKWRIAQSRQSLRLKSHWKTRNSNPGSTCSRFCRSSPKGSQLLYTISGPHLEWRRSYSNSGARIALSPSTCGRQPMSWQVNILAWWWGQLTSTMTKYKFLSPFSRWRQTSLEVEQSVNLLQFLLKSLLGSVPTSWISRKDSLVYLAMSLEAFHARWRSSSLEKRTKIKDQLKQQRTRLWSIKFQETT